MNPPAPVPSAGATAPRATRSVAYVGVGLLVYGVCSMLYLAIVARDLGARSGGAVAVLWTALNVVGIGVFAGVEQHLARSLAGRQGAPARRRAVREAGLFMVGSIVLLGVGSLVFRDYLSGAFFAGDGWMLTVLLLGMVAQGVAYLGRGALAGSRDFPRYAAQFCLDGALRVALAFAVGVSGWSSARAYGLVLVISPILSALLTRPRPDPAEPPAGGAPAAEAQPAETTGRLALIVAATAASQFVANAGPVVVAVLAAGSDGGGVSRFAYSLTVARLPLFAFAAIQAVVLPQLARSAATGDHTGHRWTLRRALVVTALLAVGGGVLMAVIGPAIIRILYGSDFLLAQTPFLLVVCASAVHVVAALFGQALLARGRDAVVVAAWLAAIVVDVVLALREDSPEAAAAVALLGASVVAVLVLGLGLAADQRSFVGGRGR